MKWYKIRNRSPNNSYSCVPLNQLFYHRYLEQCFFHEYYTDKASSRKQDDIESPKPKTKSGSFVVVPCPQTKPTTVPPPPHWQAVSILENWISK